MVPGHMGTKQAASGINSVGNVSRGSWPARQRLIEQDIIMGVTLYHLCHILLVRSKSQFPCSLPHSGGGTTQRHELQEADTMWPS